MCGIFGFVMAKPVQMTMVLRLLEKLEAHQYPNEPKPVGGYGAGVAVLGEKGNVVSEKVGKVGDSPARHLSETLEIKEASVLVGHVRLPSPQFMETARFKETAQPYVARCSPNLTVVSAHNGSVTNYKEIREKLARSHVFESERVELIDSEIIPHYFEELLKEKSESSEALDALFAALEGSNAMSLLQVEKKSLVLHFIHKGKTRGLTVWTNENDEIMFCSRKKPLMEEFGSILVKGRFKERFSIPYRQDENLKASFTFAKTSN